MGSKDVRIDNNTVSMRLMDESYIMCEDERTSGVSLDVGCRHMSPRWPNPLYAT